MFTTDTFAINVSVDTVHVHNASVLGDVTPYRRASLAKLTDPSNYWRFYLARYMRSINVSDFLYLDADTMVEGDLTSIYIPTLQAMRERGLSVASGRQKLSTCTNARMLAGIKNRTLHEQLGNYCLTASVMLVDVQRWIDLEVTATVEKWLRLNYESKEALWYLGSMPPLILALAGKWLRWDSVIDMKGVSWQKRISLPMSHHTHIFHPVKSTR